MIPFGTAILLSCFVASAFADSNGPIIGSTSGFEVDVDGNQWPDGWLQAQGKGQWLTEGTNRFVRISSADPSINAMLKREFEIPINTDAIQLTWKERITDLVPGPQSHNTARIVVTFFDSGHLQLKSRPDPYQNKTDTNGWKIREKTFQVPIGARYLTVSAGLLGVENGNLDVDDFVLRAADLKDVNTQSRRNPNISDDVEGITQQDFGQTYLDEPVILYTMKNHQGMSVKIMDRGATLVECNVPDKDDKFENVVLGFDSLEGYESPDNQFFGATIGRVCGRIGKANFLLDGREHSLKKNDGPNHLHGGVRRSLDKVVWKGHPYGNKHGIGIAFKYTSPDGEEGYPGTVDFGVNYFLNHASNRLTISFSGRSDRPTPISLTNHTYFNLAGVGNGTIDDLSLMLNADQYLETDEWLIPTGNLLPTDKTPLVFKNFNKIGKRIQRLDDSPTLGYDHTLVLNEVDDSELREGRQLACQLRNPTSGRTVKIMTTEPTLHMYSGNFLNDQKGRNGVIYPRRSAVCLMPQAYPDAVHKPTFPSVIVRPGTDYLSSTVYSFEVHVWKSDQS